MRRLRVDTLLERTRKDQEVFKSLGLLPAYEWLRKSWTDKVQMLATMMSVGDQLGIDRGFRDTEPYATDPKSVQLFKSMDAEMLCALIARERATEAKVFLFEDQDVVDGIVGANLKVYTPEMFKLPFDDILIEVPTRQPDFMPEEGGDKGWYVLQLSHYKLPKDHPLVVQEPDHPGVMVIYYWWPNCEGGSWQNFRFAAFEGIEKGRVKLNTVLGEVVHKEGSFGFSVISTALKFLAYLTSSNVEYAETKRDPPSKAKKWKRNPPPAIITTRVKKVDKSRGAVKEGSEMRHSYRYPVRGNWAVYTKGPLAGRHIWRPPHERGPEMSNLVEREYRVE